MDLITLTDDDLAAHRDAVLAEIERRQRIATIPSRIAELAAQYAQGGGDPSELVAAIEPTA